MSTNLPCSSRTTIVAVVFADVVFIERAGDIPTDIWGLHPPMGSIGSPVLWSLAGPPSAQHSGRKLKGVKHAPGSATKWGVP